MIVIVIPHRIGPGCSVLFLLFLLIVMSLLCLSISPIAYSSSAQLSSQLLLSFITLLFRWSVRENMKRFNGISMKYASM